MECMFWVVNGRKFEGIIKNINMTLKYTAAELKKNAHLVKKKWWGLAYLSNTSVAFILLFQQLKITN